MKSYLLKIFTSCAALFLIAACTEEMESVSPSTLSMSSTVDSDYSHPSMYYYYQGEKVYLKINPTTYYAARTSNHSADDIVTCINTYAPGVGTFHAPKRTESKQKENTIAPIAQKEAFTTSYSLQNTVSSDNYVAKLHNIAKNNDILYVTPCFVSEDNKEFSNSPYIYVKLKEKKDTALLKEVAQKLSLDFCENVSYMPLWYKVSCLNNKQECSIELANKVYETGLFESAEPGFVGAILPATSHSDPFYNDQWGLENTGQYEGTSGIDIKAKDVHSLSNGTGITIGIFDCGVEYSHPDLLPYTKSYDAYKDIEYQGSSTIYKTNVYVDDNANENERAHGTCCAGIAGAQSNSSSIGGTINTNTVGICGVANTCMIASISLPISIADQASFARGFAWAYQNKIDVISCSWGGNTPSDIITEAIKQAATKGRNGKGCTIAFATGNENLGQICYSSSLDEVISVGAIDMFGKRKTFGSSYEPKWGSNYGEGTDVVAPGIRISTTDISGNGGLNSGSTVQKNAGLIDYQDNNYTKIFNGTSAATPFVAGIAALILERKPSLTSKEVRSIIQSTCTKLPDYFTSTTSSSKTDGPWNQEVGYGLVNAYNAVVKAIMGNSQYVITGNSLLTNTTWNNFIVSNIPRGTYITWSISDNENFTISQNGYNSVLVKAKQTGKSAILTATITTTSGSSMQSISIEISSLY